MGVGASTALRWDDSMMASQKGKLAIVTGANSGVGFEAAKALATHGAHVILACRSESRGRQAEEVIRQTLSEVSSASVGSVEFMQVDIGEPDSVREFARVFRLRFDHLDLLLNNAGVSVPPQRRNSQGVESHFAINHLGHFYLTHLLLDLLRKSSTQARVVNVSSRGHKFARFFLDFATMGHTPGGFGDYCTSKLANLLFTYELQRRLEAAGIENVVAVAAHPGVCHTELFNKFYLSSKLPGFLQQLGVWVVSLLPLLPQNVGVRSILYAATEPRVRGGQYYGPVRGYPALETSSSLSYSLENSSKLWELSETTLGRKFLL